MEQKSLLIILSSAAPQRTAYSKVPSQMAAHLRTAVHRRLGRLLDSNPGLQFYNLVSLPMSHHCSQRAVVAHWEQWWLIGSSGGSWEQWCRVYTNTVSYVCMYQQAVGGRGRGGGGVGLVSLRTQKSLNHKIGEFFSRCIPLFPSLLIYFLWLYCTDVGPSGQLC